MNKTIHTKFGNARQDKGGYYRITSKKEGNALKYLHRLIFEDFYGIIVPQGYIVHHKNGNKQDNCILNLQLMKKSHHDTHHGMERSTTKYFRVYKNYDSKIRQGFRWAYQYHDMHGKRKAITSVNLNKLKEKVLGRGLTWKQL